MTNFGCCFIVTPFFVKKKDYGIALNNDAYAAWIVADE